MTFFHEWKHDQSVAQKGWFWLKICWSRFARHPRSRKKHIIAGCNHRQWERIISYIMKNKTCSKPPTSICWYIIVIYQNISQLSIPGIHENPPTRHFWSIWVVKRTVNFGDQQSTGVPGSLHPLLPRCSWSPTSMLRDAMRSCDASAAVMMISYRVFTIPGSRRIKTTVPHKCEMICLMYV